MPRKPNWTRDELVLALDLYFEVVELSGVLNRLKTAPGDRSRSRNISSIAMKLGNFSRLDSGKAGGGLPHGSKLDNEIWHEFAQDRTKLKKEAAALRRKVAAN